MFNLGLMVSTVAIVLPVSAVLAVAAQPSSRNAEEGAGLCTELGCRNGNAKCADGTLTTAGGTEVKYTCYTTIAET
ncbi:MAG: hypothetical protein C0497_13380 [Gemmatimonas sp.]|nr:hypothetical protein [Gemmatimonas sp.]